MKTRKTDVNAPLHTGHSDTALMQLAHRQRWPHGTTAYSALSSKQMAHSVVAGSVEVGLGGSGSGSSSSLPSAFSLPLDAAIVAMYGFATTLSSNHARTEC